MSIEESFRDLKSLRFGWGFEHVRSRHVRRIENLLLIAALASLTVYRVGLTACKLGLDRTLQANTVRKRRVLSHHFTGRWFFAHRSKPCSWFATIRHALSTEPFGIVNFAFL